GVAPRRARHPTANRSFAGAVASPPRRADPAARRLGAAGSAARGARTGRAAVDGHRTGGGMTGRWGFLALAATNLRRHRLRALIGVAGIGFGVAAMLTILAIVTGAIGMFE